MENADLQSPPEAIKEAYAVMCRIFREARRDGNAERAQAVNEALMFMEGEWPTLSSDGTWV